VGIIILRVRRSWIKSNILRDITSLRIHSKSASHSQPTRKSTTAKCQSTQPASREMSVLASWITFLSRVSSTIKTLLPGRASLSRAAINIRKRRRWGMISGRERRICRMPWKPHKRHKVALLTALSRVRLITAHRWIGKYSFLMIVLQAPHKYRNGTGKTASWLFKASANGTGEKQFRHNYTG